jgi:hypothetical protein
MGAWGEGMFENDGAEAWWDEMQEAASAPEGLRDFLAATLAKANSPANQDYLEVDDGQELVAAALVVAWITGLSPEPAEDVDASRAKNPAIVAAQQEAALFRPLAKGAVAALDRARDEESSELAQLWAEAGENDVMDEQISRAKAHLSGFGA